MTADQNFKLCTGCKQSLPNTHDYFDWKVKGIRLRTRCRACRHKEKRIITDEMRLRINAAQRLRYKENPEPYKKRSQEWHDNNKELVAEIDRRSRQEHLEERRQRDIERRRNDPWKAQERDRKQYQKHRDRYIAKAKKRTMLLRHLVHTLQDADWQRAIAYFGGRCATCGRPPGLWHTLAQDHWIPIADTENCPGTVPENIVPLCHGIDGCNNKKRHSNPDEWLTTKFGKHKAKQIVQRIDDYFAWVKQQG